MSRINWPFVLLLSAIIGCSVFHREAAPKAQDQWQEVACEECGGKGFVVYGADHEWVKAGLVKDGCCGACPMCSGSGKLLTEPTRN